MEEIRIGQPYIETVMGRGNQGKVRLCADISGIINMTLWYEVEDKFREYLCVERVDAFLIGVLPYALSHADKSGLKIICEGKVSERLYYQLKTHYIPAMVKNVSFYDNIIIEASLDHTKLKSAHYVGIGVSGGVDSYYSILKSLEEDSQNYKVTHGLYIETEALGEFENEMQQAMRNMAREICNDCNIEFIDMKTNIVKGLYDIVHSVVVSNIMLSCVFALQKLFHIYYFSSTYSYESFKFVDYDGEYRQLFDMYCFSTEDTELYVTGADAMRHEKTDYIARFNTPKKMLMVCRNPIVEDGIARNCSRCSKCTRTMIDLDLHDKLSDFSEIFDVEYYYKNPVYYWGYLYFKGKKDTFIKETLEYAKKKRKSVKGARLAGLIKIIKNKGKRGNPLRYTWQP